MQVVVVLHRDEARGVARILREQILRHLPREHAGRAEIAHLAGAHQIVQRVDGLFDRRAPVEAVDLVQVDEVGVEPLQRGVARFDDVLARQPEAVARAVVRAAVALRRNHYVVTIHADLAQRSPQHFFRGAVGVNVRGVEEIDAGVDRAGDERFRFTVFEHPVAPLLGPVRHHAEADARHGDTRAAEVCVFHRSVPLLDYCCGVWSARNDRTRSTVCSTTSGSFQCSTSSAFGASSTISRDVTDG